MSLSPTLRHAWQEKARDYTDPDQAKAVELERERLDAERRAVERTILSDPKGRAWLWQLLSECHVWEKKLNASGVHYEQGFLDGRREVGLSLMRGLARSDADAFAAMLKENDKL